MSLRIKKLNKSFKNLVVYKDFDIEFAENKVNCLIGSSGCGKTTLLNLISGILKAESGDLSDFRDKRVSYIFQEPRLLPWKTLRGNIEFVLRDFYPQQDCAAIADKFIALVNLSNFEQFYPKDLSGGMKQRVAIARAFAYPSEILLMDEPFKALDWKLRGELIKTYKLLWEKDNKTTILVTHDVEEALKLSDKIFVLKGPPAAVLDVLEMERFTYLGKAGDQKFRELRNYIHSCLSGEK